MTTFLLDANVLIALIDPAHVRHDDAHEVGHTRYPNTPGNPSTVAPLLARLHGLPGHRFWADDISALDNAHLDASRLLSAGQVTDTYLLALARAHDGRLATFDRRLVTDAVADGRRHVHMIA